jgi:rhomboid protease GluP
MDSHDEHDRENERPIAARKREAEDWALVLIAEGFTPTLRREPEGWSLEVPPAQAHDAALLIAAWQQERIERADRERANARVPVFPSTPAQTASAYAFALTLLTFHLGLIQSGRHAGFIQQGKSQAALVMDGELWRTVTALTLHTDLPHVLGNTLFGGFFLAALAGRLGVGCGVLAFLVSGLLGNTANAIYYGVAHSSVGASTGVFGLVGVLAGLAAWRRHQTAAPGRGAWVAFAAGLAIVAMLGSGGPRVDVSAHLFGLVAGGLAGLLIAAPLAARPRPGTLAQAIAILITVGTVAGCWAMARPAAFGIPT